MSYQDDLNEVMPKTGRVMGETEVFNLGDLLRTYLEGVNGGVIQVIGEDGNPWDVKQGIGLGIRQHDDVMLSWGLSKFVQKEFTLAPNEYAMVGLTVPTNVNHHLEARTVYVRGANVEVWVVPNYGALPGGSADVPIWNQKGPYLEAVQDRRSVFSYWVPSATNPITTDPVEGEWIGHLILHAETGSGNRVTTDDFFESAKGRYYQEGTHVILFKNIDTNPAEVVYNYSWHDFI